MILPFAAFPKTLAGRAVGPLTRLLASSASGAAGSAALAPTTSDESRSLNMAMAAGLGTVIPGGGAATGSLVKKGARMLSESGARQQALERIAQHFGPEAQDFLERLTQYRPPTVKGQPADIPISAVQASNDPVLAQLEAASRSHPGTSPSWNVFDAAQNARRWQTVENLTPSELRVARLRKPETWLQAPCDKPLSPRLNALATMSNLSCSTPRHCSRAQRG